MGNPKVYFQGFLLKQHRFNKTGGDAGKDKRKIISRSGIEDLAKKFFSRLFHVGEIGSIVNMSKGVKIPETYILFNGKTIISAHLNSSPLYW